MAIKNRPEPPLPSFIQTEDERESGKTAQTREAFPANASPINVARVERNINESLRKQIVDIINKNPDFALSVIRGWKDRSD